MWEKQRGFEQASTSKVVTVVEPNIEKVTSEGTQRVERISHALMPFPLLLFLLHTISRTIYTVGRNSFSVNNFY